MRSGGRLIERYVARAVLPYVLLALLLLTAVLLAQQSARIAEVLAAGGPPLRLVAEVSLDLIPGVLVFALPVAQLAGTVIGFSRMGGDSETAALRAAGVGTMRLVWPVTLLGLLLTGAAFYLNLSEAPRAAHDLRRVALQAALYRLDSPVEPRAFNLEIPGYVVYVRDGDRARGEWGRVFIYAKGGEGGVRLVTARSGRIDSAGDHSELVLGDAVAAKLPDEKGREGAGAVVLERLAQLRIQFNTGRAALSERLRRDEREPDEMSWVELGRHIESKTGAVRRDAETLRGRRLTMSLAPLVFAFLGAGLGLRVQRGGRGLGLLLVLGVLLAYYLASLLGEQTARAGTVPVWLGTWLATVLGSGLGLLLLLSDHRGYWRGLSWGRWVAHAVPQDAVKSGFWGRARATRWLNFPGLMDISLLKSLSLSFLFSYAALVLLFLIFTLFEIWRFIVMSGAGPRLITMYVVFLLPLISVQVMPPGALIGGLFTYALLSRRSEAVAWWSSGQSTYRLMLPALVFAAALGSCLWLIQERLMPGSNVRQDALRAQIRGGARRATAGGGRQWLADTDSGRIYAYEYDEQDGTLKTPSVYEFNQDGVHLKRAVFGQEGRWRGAERVVITGASVFDFEGGRVGQRAEGEVLIEGAGGERAFRPTSDRPSQLSAKQLSDYIKQMKKRGRPIAALAVALERRYAEPFSALALILTGVPLALAFGRRNTLAAVSSAIATSLLFWALSGGFQQMGAYDLLPPAVAAWAPLFIFAALGSYMLTRTRT